MPEQYGIDEEGREEKKNKTLEKERYVNIITLYINTLQ